MNFPVPGCFPFAGPVELLVNALIARIEQLEEANGNAQALISDYEVIAVFLWPDAGSAKWDSISAIDIIEELKRRGIGAGGRE